MEGGGSSTDSVEDLSRAITLHRDNLIKALLARARHYVRFNRSEDALTDANLAINLNPLCGRAYLCKGFALYTLKVYEDAKSSIREGLSKEKKLHHAELSGFIKMMLDCTRKIEDTQGAPKIQKLLTCDKEDFGPSAPLVGVESVDLLEDTQGAAKNRKLKDTLGAGKKQKLKDTLVAPKKQKLLTSEKDDVRPPAPPVGDMPKLLIASKPYYSSCGVPQGQDIVEMLRNLGKKVKSCITVIGGIGKVTRANLGGRVYDAPHLVVSAQGIITPSGDVKVNMCICSQGTTQQEKLVYGGLVCEGTLAGSGLVMMLATTPEFYEA